MNDTVNVPREARYGDETASQIVRRWAAWIIDASADMEQPEWGGKTDNDVKNERDFLIRSLLAAAPRAELEYRKLVRDVDRMHEDGTIPPEATEGGVNKMTLDEYQSRTSDTGIYPGKGTPLGLIYCGLKLAGEAGEVAEKIGKAIRDDGFGEAECATAGDGYHFKPITPDRRQAIKGELGDVLWYVASLARELGFDLSDIAQSNIDKLADRKQRGVLSGDGDNR